MSKDVPDDLRTKELWVPTGHFYSPLVDPADVHVRTATDSEAHPSVTASSLGLNEPEMLRWFSIISQHYHSNPFSERPSPTSKYHYANPNFPLADALALLGIMLEKKPRRYVEVGCGYSSCAAIDINEKYLNGRVEMTFIDPFPDMFLKLIGSDSQYSSHVGKTGSDVLDYLFRVLPALPAGVLIHIHDIFFPFEYPASWIVDENRSWNEAYLLRAFLLFNPVFQVIYFSDWIYKCRRELFATSMPLCVQHRGGSIWIEKRN